MTDQQERDTEREAFEAWAVTQAIPQTDLAMYSLVRRPDGHYRYPSTHHAWLGYQAARSQQQQQAAEALRAARECILMDRTALADTHMNPATNAVDEDGQAGLDEYDAVLAKIDAALSELTGGGNG